jgi:hypothetical protein
MFFLVAGGYAATAQLRSMTDTGVPLDEPILVRLRDVPLRVPAAYLWPWPSQAMRNRVNDLQEIGFSFWMPERRHLETNPLSLLSFRPKEPGRDEPSPDAYVVEVRQLQPVKLDEPGYISPEQRFRNLTSISGLSSYSFEEEPFGLVRFWRHDWPHKQPESFLNYRNVEASDPQIELRCTPVHRTTAVNPLCDGTVHFATDGLGFYVRFSIRDLPRWREIAFAVRDLFKSWKDSR